MSRRVAARIAAVLVAAAVLGGCTDDQDPGLVDQGDTPATTSNTLGPCPAGGPDATTSPAGCLDADGRLQRG